MTNPILIAAKGKGFIPMLARGRVIASRYGLTPSKMDHALAILLDVLTQYNCSATIPVTASALVLNPTLARKYSEQGLELAIHGLRHIDYSLLSLDEQLRHLSLARDIFEKLQIPIAGFRCPYLRWSPNTLAALAASGFTYDSSQGLALDVVGGLETDAYRHVLEFYRALPASQQLALPGWSDELVRIPYCLPDDESLVDRLHITNPAVMAEIWLAMLAATYQSGELFTLGLHPERVQLCQVALQAVLEKARSLFPSVWIARLDEIMAWYLALGKTTFDYQHESDGIYHIHIFSPAGATILVRGLPTLAVTRPWAQGYQSVVGNRFSVQSSRRPWVGLAPHTPATLERFLRHQGYLVEKSAEPQAYSTYVDRATFHPQDEKPLLAELDREHVPLVRLSRWPGGARSGLTITGDVDALTIWDYGKRIFNL